jgi:uncharacterized membrane protein YdjX (TVP38/TMEM64 family)
MSKRLKQVIIIVLTIAFFLIYKMFLSNITAGSIRDWITGFGALAPIAYIIVWVVLPVFFFPVPILALAGGLSFGLWLGTLYTLIGAALNSSLMFWIAKLLARDMVNKYLEDKMPKKWWDKFMKAEENESFLIVFICRLIPAMPYNVINYASGLTNIPFSKYTIATIIGIFPGTVIFLNVGDKILDIHSPEFIVSIVLVILLTLGSILLGKMVSKKKENIMEKRNY